MSDKTRLAACVAVLSMMLLGVAVPARATSLPALTNVFNEANCPAGDAGNTLALACHTGAGPYDGFSGVVGNIAFGQDLADVFAFHWVTTAPFNAQFVVLGGAAGLSLYDYLSHVLLYQGALALTACSTNSPCPSNILIPSLAAGDYLLKVEAAFDPPFTVGVFDLNGERTIANITTVDAVPEPTTLLLLATGVAAAASRRRKSAS